MIHRKPNPTAPGDSRLHGFNLQHWIDKNRHQLQPPVGNQQIWPGADLMVTVVGGPNKRTDVAQVPLQDVDASCREVERAMANGHIGVEIGNHVGNKDFEDKGIVTFLHHCADIGCPVLEHPWDVMGRDGMNHMMQWLVAMPAETHLAMLYLVLSGALERLPESLHICFAHGGGNCSGTRCDSAWRPSIKPSSQRARVGDL
jgi:predicted TIM-barrel fold metal-dependent hydrolase